MATSKFVWGWGKTGGWGAGWSVTPVAKPTAPVTTTPTKKTTTPAKATAPAVNLDYLYAPAWTNQALYKTTSSTWTTQKTTAPTVTTPTAPVAPTITVPDNVITQPEAPVWEAPWPTGNITTPEVNTGVTQWSWWQEKVQTWPEWQHWQTVGNVWWMNVWQAQQQQPQYDWGKFWGAWSWGVINNPIQNIDYQNQQQWIPIGSDMTQSAVGQTQPFANAPIHAQTAQNKYIAMADQWAINAIKHNADLWLANSPDSPFWNKFGQPAVDSESQLPWYMNERNKVVASSLMLKNPNMKYMTEAARKDLILRDIVDRQEWGIDPNIDWRYKKTVDNINNLIKRDVPTYTANDYFNAILSGEKIDYVASQGNPQLKSARARYNDLQAYSTMSVSSLTKAISDGHLNKWGQLWNDLLNKGMWQMLDTAYSAYNMQVEATVPDYVMNQLVSFDTSASLADQASPTLNLWTGLEWQVSTKLLSLMIGNDLPTLASFLNADPDVVAAKTASRATETEINNLADQIATFSDDIKTKVVEKGGEATDDPFLNAYIAEKTKPFTRQLTALNSKYRNEIALLTDVSENARVEFETKEYNRTAEINGYKFILDRLDKQKAEQTAAKQAALQQSNRERTFAKWNMPNMQTVWYDDNGKPIMKYYDPATNTWKSADGMWWTSAPTGQLTPVNFWGKTFETDSALASVLPTLEEQLRAAWIKWHTGAMNWPRSAEEQAKLVKEWKSWTMDSKHNKGTALDMYEETGYSTLGRPTDKMVQIMNANGLYQDPELMAKWDYGHFDFRWTTNTQQTWNIYNSMNATDQWYVQALANYTADLPSKMNKSYTKYIAAAQEIDPTWDQNQYAARKKFLGSRAGGNDAANITSINTTVWHMSTLLDGVTWLWNDKAKIVNKFVNRTRDQFWDPRVTNFETAAKAVWSELAKVFKWGQASPSEEEIKSRSSIFNNAQSEEQLTAAVTTASKLLASRMKALTETYYRNIGRYPEESILYPETRATLEKLWFDPNQFVWWSNTTTKTPTTQTTTVNPYANLAPSPYSRLFK